MVNMEEKIIKKLKQEQETLWLNPDKVSFNADSENSELSQEDVEDAEKRFIRFAPLIQKYFPETAEREGIIESPLIRINAMREVLCQRFGSNIEGTLLLKEDSHLAIAGSVKARGGIYEVLRHTENLVKEHSLLGEGESYAKLGEPEIRAFFQKYIIQVGSTGNLGLSIGIISAVLGYHVIVHMSADAKQWKKELLRSYGVDVREYQGDYGEAVKRGRELSDQDPFSYFVDDENSRDLFLGYSVAGKRLKEQLDELEITVDESHPLFVYIPCGVGGAPGGITFGLKQVFGDLVHCFFVEPVQAPCMLLGMATGLGNRICVQDIGLNGTTQADGLAVGRPSAFVGNVMKPMLSGAMTVQDDNLFRYMKALMETENVFLEPSACAGFQGAVALGQQEEMKEYLRVNEMDDKMYHATHIVWATGGSLVPESIRGEYMNTAVTIEERQNNV